MVLESHVNFLGKFFCPQNWENGPKNGPKTGFFGFFWKIWSLIFIEFDL